MFRFALIFSALLVIAVAKNCTLDAECDNKCKVHDGYKQCVNEDGTLEKPHHDEHDHDEHDHDEHEHGDEKPHHDEHDHDEHDHDEHDHDEHDHDEHEHGDEKPHHDELDDEHEESMEPSPEPAVCIAIHALSHLSQDQLVFSKHRFANVLCDEMNNCATPGHIVHYKSRPMMMKNYCNIVACKNEVMRVNSPKWSKAFRVPSNSNELQFTAYAARFETRTEERLMKLAVHMGL